MCLKFRTIGWGKILTIYVLGNEQNVFNIEQLLEEK